GCLGQRVGVRQDVSDDRIVVRWAGTIIATHRVAAPGTREVWDPEYRRDAEHGALARHARTHLRVVDAPTSNEVAQNASEQLRIALGGTDYDVAVVDLGRYTPTDDRSLARPRKLAEVSMSNSKTISASCSSDAPPKSSRRSPNKHDATSCLTWSSSPG